MALGVVTLPNLSQIGTASQVPDLELVISVLILGH